MQFDSFSGGMIGISFVLAPFAGLIVGSQSREDARSIADWSFVILLPLLLLASTRFAPGPTQDLGGGLGLVVLFSSLIVAVGVGCRVASARPPAPPPGRYEDQDDDDDKPIPWDDELA